MADREKVIRELKAARLFFEMGSNRADGVVGNLGCKSGMKYIDDALALLKEQETGHWIFLTDCSNSGVYCSECNTKVFDSYPFKKKLSYFCPHCGTRMEGEIERR